jgi:alpha-D-xyloside xylohydrolase
MLVRDGAVIPHMKVAQSTMQLDWSKLEMVVFAAGSQNAHGLICLPSDNVLHGVEATQHKTSFVLADDPLNGKAAFSVRLYSEPGR